MRAAMHQVGADEPGEGERAADGVCVAWARRSSRKAIRATAIWMRTAFSEVPRKRLIFRVCLTQRKNSSIAQRRL